MIELYIWIQRGTESKINYIKEFFDNTKLLLLNATV